jgi:hypothetical protein
MGTFTFNLPGAVVDTASAAGKSVNQGLYTGTPDDQLTYTGSDYIVWDRVNGERIRRGLPGLAAIGSPRPPQEAPAAPPSASGTAQTFEIKGPPGMTFEQAKTIFDQQVKTGGLVGFKPGEVLSAATQAAQGLPEAQALLSQAQSGITGALGSVGGAATAAIGSVSKAVGAAGGALNGSIAGIAAGVTGVVGPAISNITGAASSIANQAVAAGKALVGTAASVGSVATSAIATINKNLSTPVNNPIDITGFAKAPTALTGIASMTQSEVTGVLAQAKQSVGQAAGLVTDAKGLGEFGLDINQLEKAGIVKPGMAALAAQTGAAITDVLKSPAAFTGKDGIKNVQTLLNSPATQAAIQQNLMASGVKDLASIGIPVDKLSPQGIAGVALNAAKSVPGTEAFLKGGTIPNDPTGAVKAAFQTNVRDGAFAVALTDSKIPPAFKEVQVPEPKNNTVNRDTVNAAGNRVVGNDKVPEPNYGPPTPPDTAAQGADIKVKIDAFADLGDKVTGAFGIVDKKIDALAAQQTVTQEQWNAVWDELTAARSIYNDSRSTIVGPLFESYDRASPQVQAAYKKAIGIAQQYIDQLTSFSTGAKSRMNLIASKIAGPA